MNINDLLGSGHEADDMDTMNSPLDYENPELMTSDFFDSVLSLENNLEQDFFFSSTDDEVNQLSESSSHAEVLSPHSVCSESERSSVYTDNVDETASVLSSMDGIDDSLLMSFLESPEPESTPEISAEPPTPPVVTKSKPTKILIQNPNNKKVITKPLIHTNQIKKNGKSKPNILKVQSISNNGRSILVPLSVKSIKILDPKTGVPAFTGNITTQKIEGNKIIHVKDNGKIQTVDNMYPPLNLTSEEKRLLAKEGIHLPSHYPLTKNEDRELKRIRRKIRNKISAQDSRKRKKEYVDGLEERIKRGSEENKNLLQRVKELQRQNKTLIAHVSKLQTLICSSSASKATPSTCLMVVLLSALLVSLPNMRLFENNKQLSTEQEQVTIRRSLLSSQQTTEEDALNMEEFLVFKEEDASFDKFVDELDIENSTDKKLSKLLEEVQKKYEGILSDKNASEKNIFNRIFENVKMFLGKEKPEWLPEADSGGFYNNKGFIEPDIDDNDTVMRSKSMEDQPPAKKMRHVFDQYEHNDYVPYREETESEEKVVTATVNSNIFVNSKDK